MSFYHVTVCNKKEGMMAGGVHRCHLQTKIFLVDKETGKKLRAQGKQGILSGWERGNPDLDYVLCLYDVTSGFTMMTFHIL